MSKPPKGKKTGEDKPFIFDLSENVDFDNKSITDLVSNGNIL